MIKQNDVWLLHNCTKQWLISAYGQIYSPILRRCSLLLLTVRFDETCLLFLWDYDKKWSIPLSVLWMSDWLCDSDLRWWCSRCLSVGQDPGLSPLSSALHIPADTHKTYCISCMQSFTVAFLSIFYSIFRFNLTCYDKTPIIITAIGKLNNQISI